jgi:hypothetical protein
VLTRNVAGLTATGQQQERRKGAQEGISDAITRFTGSSRFVYIHAALSGCWLIWNLGLHSWTQFRRAGDDGFGGGDFLLSTLVLISQNRMQAQAEKWQSWTCKSVCWRSTSLRNSLHSWDAGHSASPG